MDISPILTAAVNGIPIVIPIMVLVFVVRKLGAEGRELTLASFLIGAVIGAGYIVAMTRPPAGDWWIIYVYAFGALLYGVTLGGLASLLYDQQKELLARLLAKLLEALAPKAG